MVKMMAEVGIDSLAVTFNDPTWVVINISKTDKNRDFIL